MEFDDVTSLGIGTTQLMRGFREPLDVDNPAVGSAFTYAVSRDYWERILAITGTFTTSAVVANRYLRYEVIDADSKVLMRQATSVAIPASTAVLLSAHLGADLSLDTTTLYWSMPIPDLVLKSGEGVQITALNIDAADAFTGLKVVVQRFPSDVASGDEYEEMLTAWRARIRQITGTR